ncbi:MAG: type II secretion system protein GspI, partial [Hyphomonadaceae bacterium]|nr:type II secretion system protein GspI [Hyphomonadaceae bacterium]
EPVLGRQDGEQTQMGRKFDWELDIERTDVPGFLELTVNVRAQDTSQVLITRTAYLSQQRRTAPASGTSPGQGAKP